MLLGKAMARLLSLYFDVVDVVFDAETAMRDGSEIGIACLEPRRPGFSLP